MTKEEIEAIVNARVDAALSIQFRKLLDLAINGGPGAFTEPTPPNNLLPLIRDQALVRQFDEHLANHASGSAETEHSHSQYVLRDALRQALGG